MNSTGSLKEITSCERGVDKITNIGEKKIKYGTISYFEQKQSKYRKKFQMAGDSYIRFKAEETFIFNPAKHFGDIAINYHTPNVTTAVILYMHRLASF